MAFASDCHRRLGSPGNWCSSWWSMPLRLAYKALSPKSPFC